MCRLTRRAARDRYCRIDQNSMLASMRSVSSQPAGAQLLEEDHSSTDRVVNHITAGILAGRYVPGQRLVEVDLTQVLKISRGPVREAFRRLDALGLVSTSRHRGAWVRTLSRTEAV